MTTSVFTSAVAHSLKRTLANIIDDKTDGYESNLVMKRWLTQSSMEDAFEDDLEMSGLGLAQEVPEGSELPSAVLREGYVTRYIARKFGLKVIVTEEAMEDCKYEQVIQAARRLKRAMWKTVDIDATNLLVRAFNSSYTGADGVCLGNASHTLATGGTFSNIMATPMSPSRAAWIVATTAIRKMVGHDGIIEGYEPEKIVCPLEQWATWAGIVGSERAPEPGAFNEINVANTTMDSDSVVPIKYWTNTTTNWGMTTDAENGLNLRWRKKPRSRTWVNNDQESMSYGISARWTRGWSDPRAFYGVNA